MEVTINAVSGPSDAHDGLPAYQEHINGPTIRITVRTPQNGRESPFEFVRLRLQGAIKTQIGLKTSVEKVLNLMEECSWSQFVPDEFLENHQCATVAFNENEKPTSVLSSLRNRPLPSTNMSGSAYVTKHTALVDQHLVHGRCETHSWVTADFYRGGTLIQSSRATVDFHCDPSLLSIRTRKSHERELPAITCRSLRNSFVGFRRSMRGQPSATVQLPEHSIIVPPNPIQDHEDRSTFSLPLQVSLSQLSQAEISSLHQEGGLACEIETKWSTQTTFATGSLEAIHSESAKVSRRAASTQRTRVVFPPVYAAGSAGDHTTVSTTGTMQLVRPTSAALPTLSSDLLRVNHEMEMKYRFRLGSGIVLEGKAKMACVLES